MNALVKTGTTSDGGESGNAAALVGGCALIFGIGNCFVIALLRGSRPEMEAWAFVALA